MTKDPFYYCSIQIISLLIIINSFFTKGVVFLYQSLRNCTLLKMTEKSYGGYGDYKERRREHGDELCFRAPQYGNAGWDIYFPPG